jgi:hypothetical protein|tara:strand:- start:40 stop:1434 length:1395 start_codon:yes stop_codon:yes gene_type:complete
MDKIIFETVLALHKKIESCKPGGAQTSQELRSFFGQDYYSQWVIGGPPTKDGPGKRRIDQKNGSIKKEDWITRVKVQDNAVRWHKTFSEDCQRAEKFVCKEYEKIDQKICQEVASAKKDFNPDKDVRTNLPFESRPVLWICETDACNYYYLFESLQPDDFRLDQKKWSKWHKKHPDTPIIRSRWVVYYKEDGHAVSDWDGNQKEIKKGMVSDCLPYGAVDSCWSEDGDYMYTVTTKNTGVDYWGEQDLEWILTLESKILKTENVFYSFKEKIEKAELQKKRCALQSLFDVVPDLNYYGLGKHPASHVWEEILEESDRTFCHWGPRAFLLLNEFKYFLTIDQRGQVEPFVRPKIRFKKADFLKRPLFRHATIELAQDPHILKPEIEPVAPTGIRKALHSVRGFRRPVTKGPKKEAWSNPDHRSYRPDENDHYEWIKDHTRGDAALGKVTHDYKHVLEKKKDKDDD